MDVLGNYFAYTVILIDLFVNRYIYLNSLWKTYQFFMGKMPMATFKVNIRNDRATSPEESFFLEKGDYEARDTRTAQARAVRG